MSCVHFFEAFDEEKQLLGQALPEGCSAVFSRETVQESGVHTPDAPLICVRTQSGIPAAWLPSLQGVLSRSTGYDHLRDLAQSQDSCPALGHLSEYCSRAVAEHAVLVAGALLRKLPQQCRHMSTFLRSGLTGREMRGRRLVVLGAGRIGGEVARLALALHMDVIACDPVQRHDWLDYLPLEQAVPEADVLICAMELTPENHGLLDRNIFSRLPKGAIFVNVARGEFVVLRDLLHLYQEGRLGGIGLDVYPDEADLAIGLRRRTGPTKALHVLDELMQLDNVVLTPHNAFNTEESLQMKVQETIAELEHFRSTGRFSNPIPLDPAKA